MTVLTRAALHLAGLELLRGLLVRDPSKRLSAEAALNHEYFKMHLGWHAEEPRLLQVRPVDTCTIACSRRMNSVSGSNQELGISPNWHRLPNPFLLPGRRCCVDGFVDCCTAKPFKIS